MILFGVGWWGFHFFLLDEWFLLKVLWCVVGFFFWLVVVEAFLLMLLSLSPKTIGGIWGLRRQM